LLIHISCCHDLSPILKKLTFLIDFWCSCLKIFLANSFKAWDPTKYHVARLTDAFILFFYYCPVSNLKVLKFNLKNSIFFCNLLHVNEWIHIKRHIFYVVQIQKKMRNNVCDKSVCLETNAIIKVLSVALESPPFSVFVGYKKSTQFLRNNFRISFCWRAFKVHVFTK